MSTVVSISPPSPLLLFLFLLLLLFILLLLSPAWGAANCAIVATFVSSWEVQRKGAVRAVFGFLIYFAIVISN